MEIKSVLGRSSVVELTADEKKAYQEFLEARKIAQTKKNDYSFVKVAEQKFQALAYPFVRSLNLVPKHVENEHTRKSNLLVQCEDFVMGDASFDFTNHCARHGFNYTPIIDFKVDGNSLVVDRSYIVAPRLRTTLSIAKDIVGMLYPTNGDGIKAPILEVTEDGDPRRYFGNNCNGDSRVYIASAKHVQPVLARLKEVFDGIGNERLGALVSLHNDAEDRQRDNKFYGNLLGRTYRNLLETLAH
ncbi:MAG: hypothetical protein Q8N99_02840 [Nanoarchaeota archaeon]|nr:hypothetical protein [Nanoarchaeota archaeon]